MADSVEVELDVEEALEAIIGHCVGRVYMALGLHDDEIKEIAYKHVGAIDALMGTALKAAQLHEMMG